MALLKPGRIESTEVFDQWIRGLRKKSVAQILARIERIHSSGYFGDCKQLTDILFELRWRNGIRVYFTLLIENYETVLILVLGGNKNGQKKDISQADRMARGHHSDSW